MNSSLRRILFPLLAALLSGAGTYLVCRPDRLTASPGASTLPKPSAAEPVPLPAALRTSLSSSSAVEFLAAVRTAGAGALRQAWLENPDRARRQAVIARWAALDPRDCWQFLCSQAEGRAFDPVLTSLSFPLLFDIWTRSDPASARDALMKQTHGRIESGPALAALVGASALAGGEAWSGLLRDPRFAGYTHEKWGGSGGSRSIRADKTEALQLMASKDAALSLGLRDFAEASGFSLTEATAGEMLQSYRALSPHARKTYGERLGFKLAAEDPAKGAAVLAEMPREERAVMANSFADAWASRDPAASWQWITEKLDTGRSSAVQSWASSAPLEEAASILRNAEPSALTDSAVRTVAGRMARDDPAKAAAWALSLTDPVSRRSAWVGAAVSWAKSAPEEAIPALTAPDAPPLTNELYREVAATLAKQSPELARDYIRRLPPERARFAEKGLPVKDAE